MDDDRTRFTGDPDATHVAHSGSPAPHPSKRWAPPTRFDDTSLPRFEAPPEPEPQGPSGPPWKKIIAWGCAIVLAGIVAGWAYATFLYTPKADEDTIIPQQGVGPKTPRPSDAVRAYLEALASADLETAFALGPRAVQEGGGITRLTQTIYQASLDVAPITNIQVPVTDDATMVDAAFRLGDTDVTTSFHVFRDDAGNWRLTRTSVILELNNPGATAMPIVVNGATLPTGRIEIVPGFYHVTSNLPLVDYPENNSVQITNLDFDDVLTRPLTPVLTQEGHDAMLRAGRESLAACVQAKSLRPDNCPNVIASASEYRPETVQWTLEGDPLSSANPALKASDPTHGQVSMVMNFTISFTYADGSTNGNQPVGPMSASYTASLLVEDAASLNITWQS